MDEYERRRLVGDAILLERAVEVIRRRYPAQVMTNVTLHAVVVWMRSQARVWRREAENAD